MDLFCYGVRFGTQGQTLWANVNVIMPQISKERVQRGQRLQKVEIYLLVD